jgi:hypothetical protein
VPPAGPAAAVPAAAGIAAWKIAVGVAVVSLAAGAGGFTLAARRFEPSTMHDRAPMSQGAAMLGAPALGAAPPATASPAGAAATALSVSIDLDALPSAEQGAAGPLPERARAPVRATDRLADERRLLDRARSALARHDASEALAALRSHERAFPRGQLVEEREGMRVQALVLAHDFGSARAAGERFHKVYGRSVFLPAVDRALASAR